MACPFFVPMRALDRGPWENPPRLPLGEPYYGNCVALPEDLFAAPEEVQRELCNCGYARGRCDRFPGNAAADAVRFSVQTGVSGRVVLIYVLEKDHVPVEHGRMAYDASSKELAGELAGGQTSAPVKLRPGRSPRVICGDIAPAREGGDRR